MKTKTAGVLRNDNLNRDLELHLDGYRASWSPFSNHIVSEDIGKIESMLLMAYECGKQDRSKEVRKLLGVQS